MAPDTNHECKFFRDDSDIDTMREFLTWLRTGGMESLRESQKMAEDIRNIRKVALGAAVKSFMGLLWLAVMLGIVELFRRGMAR